MKHFISFVSICVLVKLVTGKFDRCLHALETPLGYTLWDVHYSFHGEQRLGSPVHLSRG